jgi:cytochrome c-type biogenesis protein CcmE
MHPIRKQRLWLVLGIVVVSSLAISLLVYALRDNMNLFYPPSKILAGEVPLDKTIRAGGCVVPGSIVKASDSLKVNFDVTDGAAVLPVAYEGILPDLFGEGEAAVLTGRMLESGVFLATTVLAKHDETYMPPEVAESMQNTQADPSQDHTASCQTMKFGVVYDS